MSQQLEERKMTVFCLFKESQILKQNQNKKVPFWRSSFTNFSVDKSS